MAVRPRSVSDARSRICCFSCDRRASLDSKRFGIEISGNANACCAVDVRRLGCDGIVGAKAVGCNCVVRVAKPTFADI